MNRMTFCKKKNVNAASSCHLVMFFKTLLNFVNFNKKDKGRQRDRHIGRKKREPKIQKQIESK